MDLVDRPVLRAGADPSSAGLADGWYPSVQKKISYIMFQHGYAASSCKTSGWRAATFNNVAAAPEGIFRPCSHS